MKKKSIDHQSAIVKINFYVQNKCSDFFIPCLILFELYSVYPKKKI